jgi:hypothetical protein
MDTKDTYKSQALELGVTFIGMQDTNIGPRPSFDAPVVGNFVLEDGETIEQALARKRKQFGVGQ